jgi:hypothetical protein
MGAWLRNELQPTLRETLLADDGLCRQLFASSALERMIYEHTTGARDRTRELFALLGVGLWHERFARRVPVLA